MSNRKPSARDRMLKAAKTIFAERGYADATMSDIARAASVSEASIYQHFKGKEELFLAIPISKVKENLPLIEERLFGVKEALSQLRIFIWVYVRELMEDTENSRIAFLQLKTNKAFLFTGAYRELQRFFRKITEIIEWGQRSGEIRPDINPYTARSLILGTIENLLTRWLLKDCSYNLWPYVEEAYELIESSLREIPELRVTVAYRGSKAGRRHIAPSVRKKAAPRALPEGGQEDVLEPLRAHPRDDSEIKQKNRRKKP